MIIRALRAELIKGRHAPVWIAFVVLPLIPAFLGTFNYLGNLALLKSSWYSLWTQHTLFASYFSCRRCSPFTAPGNGDWKTPIIISTAFSRRQFLPRRSISASSFRRSA